MAPIRSRSARNAFDDYPVKHRPQAGIKKRCFVFTCNNWETNPDRVEALQLKLRGNEVVWAIYVPEVGENAGTPHLQGFVAFKNKISWMGLCEACPGTWFEPAYGDYKQQWDYITKSIDGNEDLITEFGTRPSFEKNSAKGGKATKEMWDDALQAAREGDFDRIPSNIYMIHRRVIFDEHKAWKNKVTPLENVNLRLWQRKLVKIIQGPVDSRKIYWFWEDIGNVGKSWMATYLLRNHQATVLSTGKTADIAYLLDSPTIVVFDISRAQGMEHVNFGVMEDIKNGRIFSPKYESIIKAFAVPHIIVFANEPCPHGKFSADRLQEINLQGEYMSEPIPEEIGLDIANEGEDPDIEIVDSPPRNSRRVTTSPVRRHVVPPPVLRRETSTARASASGFRFPERERMDGGMPSSPLHINLDFLQEQSSPIDWDSLTW
nr:MAG: replication associated protein [Arizlama virus]